MRAGVQITKAVKFLDSEKMVHRQTIILGIAYSYADNYMPKKLTKCKVEEVAGEWHQLMTMRMDTQIEGDDEMQVWKSNGPVN